MATRAVILLAGGAAVPAVACTLCYSRVAGDVRAAVFGADFAANLAALLLPFPILLAAILLIRRVAP